MPDAPEVTVPDNEPFALVLKNAKRRIKDELAARETISNVALDRIFARASAAYDRDNAQANDLIDWYRGRLDLAGDRVRAGDKENEHLCDLVKRLARVAQDALDFANALSGIIPDNPEREKARNEIAEILAEARAAIGEDTT